MHHQRYHHRQCHYQQLKLCHNLPQYDWNEQTTSKPTSHPLTLFTKLHLCPSHHNVGWLGVAAATLWALMITLWDAALAYLRCQLPVREVNVIQEHTAHNADALFLHKCNYCKYSYIYASNLRRDIYNICTCKKRVMVAHYIRVQSR